MLRAALAGLLKSLHSLSKRAWRNPEIMLPKLCPELGPIFFLDKVMPNSMFTLRPLTAQTTQMIQSVRNVAEGRFAVMQVQYPAKTTSD